ncbi:pogo transposable element with KRAB domain-like protein [Aphelenchoides avenae]|nr:pogo transposable element with KRAB domain-like protein [Aphelenchus avenae]
MSDSEANIINDAPDPTSSGRKMKEYSVKFKLQVAEWAIANRNNNGVHAEQLQEKLPVDRRLNLSHGWLEKFMKRNKWTLRAPTSVAQKPPADYQDRVVKFVIAVEAMRKQNKFQSKHVYGADETGVWINPTGGLCVEQIGRKDVSDGALRIKLRITVMLTARSDGKRSDHPFFQGMRYQHGA